MSCVSGHGGRARRIIVGRTRANVNWDAIGAIAELLGALATVATLAYLAVQIRQNTNSVRISTATSRAEQRIQQSGFISQTPEINRIFWAGLEEPESLSETDFRYFESIFSTYLAPFEAAFNLNREDALTTGEWEGQISAMGWVATRPGFKRYWETWRSQYATDWAAFVDEVVRQSEAD